MNNNQLNKILPGACFVILHLQPGSQGKGISYEGREYFIDNDCRFLVDPGDGRYVWDTDQLHRLNDKTAYALLCYIATTEKIDLQEIICERGVIRHEMH